MSYTVGTGQQRSDWIIAHLHPHNGVLEDIFNFLITDAVLSRRWLNLCSLSVLH